MSDTRQFPPGRARLHSPYILPLHDFVLTGMPSPLPTRVTRWILAPLCLGLCASCAPGRAGGDLSYLVDLSPSAHDDIVVNLKVTGLARPTLRLVGCAAEGVLQVHDISATDGCGVPVQVTPGTDTVAVGAVKVKIPCFTLSRSGSSEANVRYTVRLGARDGNTHMGFSGRAFSCEGNGFGFATGRQIFLVPDRADPINTISVRFVGLEDARLVAPWRRVGDQWRPGERGADPRDHLVSAAIAWGQLEERVIAMGATRLRAVYAAHAEERPSARDLEALEQCALFVRKLFARDLGPEYLAILAGSTPEGDEIVGEAWGTGQGGTLLPITGRTLRTFSQRLIEAYVLHPPYRATLRDPREYWLIDATRAWYAWRAVESVGLVDASEIDGDLAKSYFTAFDAQDVDRNLEALYTKDTPDPVVREGVAPVVLRYLDSQLRMAPGGRSGVDAVIPKVFKPRGAADLWESLPGGEGRWTRFRREYAQGGDVVPVSQLSPVAPTRRRPIGRRPAQRDQLTLVYTGNTHGFLETCGCKANQSGGLARRATVLRQVRAEDPEALVLDAGNCFPSPRNLAAQDSLAILEQQFFLQMMARMRYQAASIGSAEIAAGKDHLVHEIDGRGTPFLAANIALRAPQPTPGSLVLRSHGVRIGLVGVLEPPRGEEGTAALDAALRGLEVRDPVAAASEAVAEFRNSVDLVVVMGELRPATIRRLIRARPDIDVVISSRYEQPIGTWNAETGRLVVERKDRSGFVDSTLVLYTTLDQYGLGVARVELGADRRIVGADEKEVWLREDVPDDPTIRDELTRFYRRAATREGAVSKVTGPLSGVAWPANGSTYIGAARCRPCHQEEYAQWKTTPHAAAYKTLLDRHRHFQPRCVACHVTGYGEATGYRLGDREEPLGDVQCEVCHGPGGEHASVPEETNIARAVPGDVCLSCHNQEHSDAFVYAARISAVVHSSRVSGREAVSRR